MVRCWRGYLSGARCRLAYAQLMPLPLTVSCFSKIQIGFTFLVYGPTWVVMEKGPLKGCVCGPDQTRPATRLGIRQVSGLCLLSGCRFVSSISTCVDFVCGSGLVGTQSPWVHVVEFDTDQTLSETWSQARTCLVGSMWWNLEPTLPDPTSEKVWSDPCQIPLHGPDPTKSADLSETLTDPTDF